MVFMGFTVVSCHQTLCNAMTILIQPRIVRLLCGLVLTSCCLLLVSCGTKDGQTLPLSKSAKIMLNPPPESADAVLLHTMDSATEFPQAISSLAPDIPEPEVRKVKPVGQTKADAAQPEVEVVQPVRAAVPLKQDWGGVILVPDMNRMSRGFTSRVTLTRIEAHPLADNHFRVWVRIRNDSKQDINADVACNFRALDKEPEDSLFIPVDIPVGGEANAYFISPIPDVAYYTILVR